MVYLSPLGVPEPPRLCELRNDSNLEVVCQPGNDGGLQQHFVLEAVGATSMYFNNLDSTRSTQDLLDNEISTMNDQVSTIFQCISIRISEERRKWSVRKRGFSVSQEIIITQK